MNLTDDLMDILRILVSNHEAYGGVEFFFTRNMGEAGLTYPGGPSTPVKWDLTDLLQLKEFGLITLEKRSDNLYAGKPLPFGVRTVRRQAAHSRDEPGKWRTGEPLALPPIVEQWESIKRENGLDSGGIERIPAADLRRMLATLNDIQPEGVSEAQIEPAAAELAHHYGRVRIVPAAPPGNTSGLVISLKAGAIADSDFWSRREEEFRRYDPGPNVAFRATWFSWGNHWMFYSHSDVSTSQTENTFKSLAREAAKGIGSPRGAESWKDWVDLLRLARDEETGNLLYSEDTQSSRVMSDREIRRTVDAGEVVPGGEQIEYIESKDGEIEKRKYWDTTDSTLKNVFKISAEHCLRLRSMVRRPDTLRSCIGLHEDEIQIGEHGVTEVGGAAADNRGAGQAVPEFPKRASWLKDRLRERSWNKHEVFRQGGPDHETVQKILDGRSVREDVLDKLAQALSNTPSTKKLPKVSLTDIPPN